MIRSYSPALSFCARGRALDANNHDCTEEARNEDIVLQEVKNNMSRAISSLGFNEIDRRSVSFVVFVLFSKD